MVELTRVASDAKARHRTAQASKVLKWTSLLIPSELFVHHILKSTPIAIRICANKMRLWQKFNVRNSVCMHQHTIHMWNHFHKVYICHKIYLVMRNTKQSMLEFMSVNWYFQRTESGDGKTEAEWWNWTRRCWWFKFSLFLFGVFATTARFVQFGFGDVVLDSFFFSLSLQARCHCIRCISEFPKAEPLQWNWKK